MSQNHSRSSELFTRNRQVIPGGVVSLNRLTKPEIAFERGQGSKVWDVDGHEYIDYHAGFAPYVLGHNDEDVNKAVRDALDKGLTLMGSGTNYWEGRLAELIVEHVPSVEKVQITNTGSEATFHAIRMARAATGRNGVVVMQGGYNGWHNDVAVNLMTPLDVIGPRVSPGEYKLAPISAGIPPQVLTNLHAVNYNDLDSVRYCFQRYDIAAIILEPILQNIGVVKPKAGYLQGLRELCDEFGVVLIFDEVKTGFRHAIGGYQSIAEVTPDLSVFGKAIANGYAIGAIGGREEFMSLFTHSDPNRKVLIAGTYNAHPLPTVAAIATIEKLIQGDGEVYHKLYTLGEQMEVGLSEIFKDAGITCAISRQGSAFCAYFMDHEPVDWHDLATHHDFEIDTRYRQGLVSAGIYHFPMAAKQGSISWAHSAEDVEVTLERTRDVVAKL